jgi:hypothetical protein
MREIYICSPENLSSYILYNGLKKDRNRVEFDSLDDLLNTIVSDPSLNPKKKVVVHLESFEKDDELYVRASLSTKLRNAVFKSQ